MKHTIKELPKSLAEISFTVLPPEYEPFLARAAERLSSSSSIPGFRPGKAPYEIVKQRFGEAKILEAALEEIVHHFYASAIREEGLEVVGEPGISVTKLVPGETFEYKLTVARLPKIVLGDWHNIHVSKKDVSVSETEVDKMVRDLQKMQTAESLVPRAAESRDKIVLDMEMYRGGVPIEGGSTKNHAVYLGEDQYIPGLSARLVGLRAGESREFSLEFPKEHFQKNLAGELVDFKISAHGVYELSLPALDDAFARTLGQSTLEELRALIAKNMRDEAVAKEDQRAELEALEKIVAASRFDDIPEILINSEIAKMVAELERGVAGQGLEFNEYLKQIKKSLADLKLEFVPEAMKRIRVALVIRAIAEEKNVSVSDKEVMDEVTRLLTMYAKDADAQQQITSSEYADYLQTALRNKKTLELIRSVCAQ